MTPQERELISGLFDRLAKLETQPRDPGAERAIQEGVSQAPHALYALVQTVLVQDEALKTANARIEELQAAVGQASEQDRPPGGFLDSMRDALFGGQAQRPGSVPSAGPRPSYAPPPSQPSYPGSGGYAQPAAPSGSSGPSFLGTAAAAAAGMVGGSLLLGGIRSMLGGYGHGPFAGTFNALGTGGVGSGDRPVEVVNEINEYGPVSDSPWRGADNAAGPDDADYVEAADSGYFDDSSDNDGGSGSDYA